MDRVKAREKTLLVKWACSLCVKESHIYIKIYGLISQKNSQLVFTFK